MSKLLASKLEVLPRLHQRDDPTMYRRSVVETYMVDDENDITGEDLYEMLGEHWWDVLSFAIGVSRMYPTDLAELAIRLDREPSAFAGSPSTQRIRWVADAALSHLARRTSQRREWVTIRTRIVHEMSLRAAGSRRGNTSLPLVEELELLRNPALRKSLPPVRSDEEVLAATAANPPEVWLAYPLPDPVEEVPAIAEEYPPIHLARTG